MSDDIRSFDELTSTGLLWLINRALLHPRGHALAVCYDESGAAIGWKILGDGAEVFTMAGVDEDAKLRAVTALLDRREQEPPAAATSAPVPPPLPTTTSGALEVQVQVSDLVRAEVAKQVAAATGQPNPNSNVVLLAKPRAGAQMHGFFAASNPENVVGG